MVKYFFQINDRVLVAITELKIIGNIIHKIGCRTSNALIGIENSGVFNQFFSEVKEIKNSLSYIDVKQLSSKCIINRKSVEDKYLISEFIIFRSTCLKMF